MTSKAEDNYEKDISKKKLQDNSWAIRPCFLYKEEYKECKSIRGRFHQYFIFGESIDCMSWIRDYDNCIQYEDNQDLNAGIAIIASEEKRRYDRMKSHYDNDIWIKRKQPPDDWNKPLPEWLQKKIENSYLTIRSKDLNKQGLAGDSDQRTICSIM